MAFSKCVIAQAFFQTHFCTTIHKLLAKEVKEYIRSGARRIKIDCSLPYFFGYRVGRSTGSINASYGPGPRPPVPTSNYQGFSGPRPPMYPGPGNELSSFTILLLLSI